MITEQEYDSLFNIPIDDRTKQDQNNINEYELGLIYNDDPKPVYTGETDPATKQPVGLIETDSTPVIPTSDTEIPVEAKTDEIPDDVAAAFGVQTPGASVSEEVKEEVKEKPAKKSNKELAELKKLQDAQTKETPKVDTKELTPEEIRKAKEKTDAEYKADVARAEKETAKKESSDDIPDDVLNAFGVQIKDQQPQDGLTEFERQRNKFVKSLVISEGTTDEKAKKYGFNSGYDVPVYYGRYGKKQVLPPKPLTEMTLKEITDYGYKVRKAQQANGTPWNKTSSAMGKYQIIGNTMRSIIKKLGYDDNTVFTPEVQDAMGYEIARRAVEQYKNSDRTQADLDKYYDAIHPIWVSNAPHTGEGTSKHPNAKDNRVAMKKALDEFLSQEWDNEHRTSVKPHPKALIGLGGRRGTLRPQGYNPGETPTEYDTKGVLGSFSAGLNKVLSTPFVMDKYASGSFLEHNAAKRDDEYAMNTLLHGIDNGTVTEENLKPALSQIFDYMYSRGRLDKLREFPMVANNFVVSKDIKDESIDDLRNKFIEGTYKNFTNPAGANTAPTMLQKIWGYLTSGGQMKNESNMSLQELMKKSDEALKQYSKAAAANLEQVNNDTRLLDGDKFDTKNKSFGDILLHEFVRNLDVERSQSVVGGIAQDIAFNAPQILTAMALTPVGGSAPFLFSYTLASELESLEGIETGKTGEFAGDFTEKIKSSVLPAIVISAAEKLQIGNILGTSSGADVAKNLVQGFLTEYVQAYPSVVNQETYRGKAQGLSNGQISANIAHRFVNDQADFAYQGLVGMLTDGGISAVVGAVDYANKKGQREVVAGLQSPLAKKMAKEAFTDYNDGKISKERLDAKLDAIALENGQEISTQLMGNFDPMHAELFKGLNELLADGEISQTEYVEHLRNMTMTVQDQDNNGFTGIAPVEGVLIGVSQNVLNKLEKNGYNIENYYATKFTKYDNNNAEHDIALADMAPMHSNTINTSELEFVPQSEVTGVKKKSVAEQQTEKATKTEETTTQPENTTEENTQPEITDKEIAESLGITVTSLNHLRESVNGSGIDVEAGYKLMFGRAIPEGGMIDKVMQETPETASNEEIAKVEESDVTPAETIKSDDATLSETSDLIEDPEFDTYSTEDISNEIGTLYESNTRYGTIASESSAIMKQYENDKSSMDYQKALFDYRDAKKTLSENSKRIKQLETELQNRNDSEYASKNNISVEHVKINRDISNKRAKQYKVLDQLAETERTIEKLTIQLKNQPKNADVKKELSKLRKRRTRLNKKFRDATNTVYEAIDKYNSIDENEQMQDNIKRDLTPDDVRNYVKTFMETGNPIKQGTSTEEAVAEKEQTPTKVEETPKQEEPAKVVEEETPDKVEPVKEEVKQEQPTKSKTKKDVPEQKSTPQTDSKQEVSEAKEDTPKKQKVTEKKETTPEVEQVEQESTPKMTNEEIYKKSGELAKKLVDEKLSYKETVAIHEELNRLANMITDENEQAQTEEKTTDPVKEETKPKVVKKKQVEEEPKQDVDNGNGEYVVYKGTRYNLQSGKGYERYKSALNNDEQTLLQHIRDAEGYGDQKMAERFKAQLKQVRALRKEALSGVENITNGKKSINSKAQPANTEVTKDTESRSKSIKTTVEGHKKTFKSIVTEHSDSFNDSDTKALPEVVKYNEMVKETEELFNNGKDVNEINSKLNDLLEQRNIALLAISNMDNKESNTIPFNEVVNDAVINQLADKIDRLKLELEVGKNSKQQASALKRKIHDINRVMSVIEGLYKEYGSISYDDITEILNDDSLSKAQKAHELASLQVVAENILEQLYNIKDSFTLSGHEFPSKLDGVTAYIYDLIEELKASEGSIGETFINTATEEELAAIDEETESSINKGGLKTSELVTKFGKYLDSSLVKTIQNFIENSGIFVYNKTVDGKVVEVIPKTVAPLDSRTRQTKERTIKTKGGTKTRKDFLEMSDEEFIMMLSDNDTYGNTNVWRRFEPGSEEFKGIRDIITRTLGKQRKGKTVSWSELVDNDIIGLIRSYIDSTAEANVDKVSMRKTFVNDMVEGVNLIEGLTGDNSKSNRTKFSSVIGEGRADISFILSDDIKDANMSDRANELLSEIYLSSNGTLSNELFYKDAYDPITQERVGRRFSPNDIYELIQNGIIKELYTIDSGIVGRSLSEAYDRVGKGTEVSGEAGEALMDVKGSSGYDEFASDISPDYDEENIGDGTDDLLGNFFNNTSPLTGLNKQSSSEEKNGALIHVREQITNKINEFLATYGNNLSSPEARMAAEAIMDEVFDMYAILEDASVVKSTEDIRNSAIDYEPSKTLNMSRKDRKLLRKKTSDMTPEELRRVEQIHETLANRVMDGLKIMGTDVQVVQQKSNSISDALETFMRIQYAVDPNTSNGVNFVTLLNSVIRDDVRGSVMLNANNGNHVIYLSPDMKGATGRQVFSHEMGHIIDNAVFREQNADDRIKLEKGAIAIMEKFGKAGVNVPYNVVISLVTGQPQVEGNGVTFSSFAMASPSLIDEIANRDEIIADRIGSWIQMADDTASLMTDYYGKVVAMIKRAYQYIRSRYNKVFGVKFKEADFVDEVLGRRWNDENNTFAEEVIAEAEANLTSAKDLYVVGVEMGFDDIINEAKANIVKYEKILQDNGVSFIPFNYKQPTVLNNTKKTQDDNTSKRLYNRVTPQDLFRYKNTTERRFFAIALLNKRIHRKTNIDRMMKLITNSKNIDAREIKAVFDFIRVDKSNRILNEYKRKVNLIRNTKFSIGNRTRVEALQATLGKLDAMVERAYMSTEEVIDAYYNPQESAAVNTKIRKTKEITNQINSTINKMEEILKDQQTHKAELERARNEHDAKIVEGMNNSIKNQSAKPFPILDRALSYAEHLGTTMYDLDGGTFFGPSMDFLNLYRNAWDARKQYKNQFTGTLQDLTEQYDVDVDGISSIQYAFDEEGGTRQLSEEGVNTSIGKRLLSKTFGQVKRVPVQVGERTYNLTAAQRAGLARMFEDDGIRDHIKSVGVFVNPTEKPMILTDEQMDDLYDMLLEDNEIKKLVEMERAMYDMVAKKVNNWSSAQYGVANIIENEFYRSAKVRGWDIAEIKNGENPVEVGSIDEAMASGKLFGTALGTIAANMKKRGDTTRGGVILEDTMENLARVISDLSNYMAFDGIGSRMNKILSATEQSFYDMGRAKQHKDIRESIAYLFTVNPNKGSQILTFLNARAQKGILKYRIPTAAFQSTSALLGATVYDDPVLQAKLVAYATANSLPKLASIGLVGVGRDVKNLGKSAYSDETLSMDKSGFTKSMTEMIEHSDMAYSRWLDGDIDYVFVNTSRGHDVKHLIRHVRLTSSKTSNVSEFLLKLDDIGLSGIKNFDMAAITVIWNMAKIGVDTMHPELSKGSKEYYKMVDKHFKLMVRETQPHNDPSTTVKIVRKQPMIKQFMPFMGQRFKVANGLSRVRIDVRNAVYKAMDGDIAGGRKQLTKATINASTFILVSMAIAYIRGMFKEWDNDEEEYFIGDSFEDQNSFKRYMVQQTIEGLVTTYGPPGEAVLAGVKAMYGVDSKYDTEIGGMPAWGAVADVVAAIKEHKIENDHYSAKEMERDLQLVKYVGNGTVNFVDFLDQTNIGRLFQDEWSRYSFETMFENDYNDNKGWNELK